MTSKERLQATLNHQAPDKVVVDFGSTHVTGIAASTVSRLWRELVESQSDRQRPETGSASSIRNPQSAIRNSSYRVKVHEPYQMLGQIGPELRAALGVDVVGVMLNRTMFGFENADWKPFTLFDGTEALVPGRFNVTREPNGDLLIYPEGDTTVPPSGRMPRGGYYFDSIPRQGPIDEEKLDPADNLVEFGPLAPADVDALATQARAASEAGMGAIISTPGTGFGDIALVPAMWLKHTPGIREVEEWYVSTAARRDYVYEVFTRQCEIALKNLARIAAAVGDNVQAAFVTGTDFGTQKGLFISPAAYRDLYKPFHKKINDFIHAHTKWKTFIHSCGSVVELLPDLIEAGFDILNPVQCSASGMDARTLKREFGRQLVFWGGGVDTQRTLPFGTPDEVYRQVRERIEIFNDGGGFVFNAIHNIQANVPTQNVLAMLRAIRDS
jgi:hypothetical protein